MAAIFMDRVGSITPSLANGKSFDRLAQVVKGSSLGEAQEQHGAICAFADCLKQVSKPEAVTSESFLFVAKCAEYDLYLDQKVVEFRANRRDQWASDGVTSDNNPVIAQVVDEIAGHMRSFAEPSHRYESFVGYTQSRIKALFPTAIAEMRQEANISIVLPFLEKSLSVPGDVAEFGCFRGVLSVKLAWFLKAMGSKKHFYTFDTFHGFEIADPAGGALGIGAFRDDEFNAYNFLTQWSRVLPLTPIKGDATKTCAQLTGPLSFVWLDLDMSVLMHPVLQQIWPLCGPDTIIGVDDVGRPETPTVAPWLKDLIAKGVLEEIFNSDEIAPNIFIRFLKKKGAFPKAPA
jgi:hypothetical protein